MSISQAVQAAKDNRSQYASMTLTILNRAVSKFITGNYMGIPRDAPPCNAEISIEEAYERPCNIFEVRVSSFSFNSIPSIIKINFHSTKTQELFSKNKEFIEFMKEISKKINNREESFTLISEASNKMIEFNKRGFDHENTSIRIQNGLLEIKFHSDYVEIWRK